MDLDAHSLFSFHNYLSGSKLMLPRLVAVNPSFQGKVVSILMSDVIIRSFLLYPGVIFIVMGDLWALSSSCFNCMLNYIGSMEIIGISICILKHVQKGSGNQELQEAVFWFSLPSSLPGLAGILYLSPPQVSWPRWIKKRVSTRPSRPRS